MSPYYTAIIKLFNANLAVPVQLVTTCIIYDHFFPFLDFCKRLIDDTVNPSSPKNDKHKFSPNNINAQSREKIVRIYEIITKEKIL